MSLSTLNYNLADPTAVQKFRATENPSLANAGKYIATHGHTTDNCIRPELYGNEVKGNPGTPPHILKYRKLKQFEPGKIQVHPGFVGLKQNVPEKHAYGRPNFASEPMQQVVKAQNMAGLADKFNDIREGHYASVKREPLGKSMTRVYEWPDQVNVQGDHALFGCPTKDSADAKRVLYPHTGSLEERPEHQKMYIKTHANYAPGEQRKRDYNWDINGDIGGKPETFAFGFGEQRLLNGASKAVHAERHDESFPKTVIVQKIVEDTKGVQQDALGAVKNLGQSQVARGPDFAHGIKNNVKDWNAAKCINGEPEEHELGPDRDLGKSKKLNCTNQVRKVEDSNRSFGCPTIRTDVPFKVKRSMADYGNYGDEPEAVDLLFPQTHTEMGISENDFQMMRSRAQIRQLFERIGFTYKDGKFNAIYNRAKDLCQSTNDETNVRSLMTAIEMLHDIE